MEGGDWARQLCCGISLEPAGARAFRVFGPCRLFVFRTVGARFRGVKGGLCAARQQFRRI